MDSYNSKIKRQKKQNNLEYGKKLNRHFTKEDIQVSNHEKVLASLDVRKTYIHP